MKYSIDKTLFTSILLAVILYAAMVVFSVRQTYLTNTTANWVAHTHEVLFNLEKTLSLVTDNETSSRGYLITGQPHFLTTLQKSKADLPLIMQQLQELTSDNPSQQTRIDTLLADVGKRVRFSDSAVILKDSVGTKTAADLIATARGKLYTENIRRLITSMKEEETRLLETRRKAHTKAIAAQSEVFLVVLFIVLGLMIVIFWKERERLKLKERNMGEERLKRVEERFRLLISNVKDYAIIMMDINGNIASWNKGAERIKGYKAEEIIGRPIDVFYTKEDIALEEPKFNLEVTREFGRYEKEGWRLKKDGTMFWANIVFTALYDEKGELHGYAKISRDITEKKSTEEKIAYQSKLIEEISDAIFSTNVHYQTKSWNKAAEKLFGYTAEEMIGKNAGEIIKPQITKEKRDLIRWELNELGHWTGEITYLKKDGSPLFVMLSNTATKDETGRINGYVSVCQDISHWKRLEEDLKKSNQELELIVEERIEKLYKNEKRFRALVENDKSIAGLLDKDLKVIYRNPAAESVTGWTWAEGEAIHFMDHIHPDDKVQVGQIIQNVWKNPAKPFDIVFRTMHKNGHYIWLEGILINMLHDSNISAIIINLQDITKRSLSEEKIKK